MIGLDVYVTRCRFLYGQNRGTGIAIDAMYDVGEERVVGDWMYIGQFNDMSGSSKKKKGKALACRKGRKEGSGRLVIG